MVCFSTLTGEAGVGIEARALGTASSWPAAARCGLCCPLLCPPGPHTRPPVLCGRPGALENGYSVRQAPPTMSFSSSTCTRKPCLASSVAATWQEGGGGTAVVNSSQQQSVTAGRRASTS